MALVVALVGLFVPNAIGAAPTSNWASAGYDTGRSFWNSAETTQTPARVKVAALNFTLPLAVPTEPCYTSATAPPVFSAGRLFTATSEVVSGYNQWSGQRQWSYTLPAPWRTSHGPVGMQAVDDKLVVVTTDCTTNDPLSRVFVLEAATGKPLHVWGTLDGGALAFAATDGVIVTSEQSSDLLTCVAYTLAGTRLWSRGGDYDDQCSAGLVVASAGRVFAHTFDGSTSYLSALRVADGSLLWRTPVNSAVPVAISQDGNDLYATEGSTLLVMDPSTGRAKREIPGRGSEVIAVNAGTVFTACAGTALCATRRSNGSSLWTQELGRSGDRIVVAGGVVYYAGSAFRAYQGTRIRNASDGNPVTAVAGGRIYTFQPNLNTETAVLKSYK